MQIASNLATRTTRVAGLFLMASIAIAITGCGGGEKTAGVSAPAAARQTDAIGATPVASGATAGAAPMQLTFTAANPRGSIATYEWDFKDNSAVRTGATLQHTFAEAGTYDVTLTVKDAAGNFNRASTPVTVTAGNTACTSAQATFETKVWPSMTTCTACHMAGGTAGGSGLILTSGPAAQNFNVLSAYANKNETMLLSKTIGQPSHTGGAPFVSVNDPRYKELAALLPALKTACDTTVVAAPTGNQFWTGVTFAPNHKVLARAAVLFAGRNATSAEEAAVTIGGAPVLRQTIRGYMQGPAFNAFLDEAGETQFLTRGATILGDNIGYNATDWPTAANIINNTNLQPNERNRFIAAARAEPIELMKHIVNQDRPWTDMVSGRYTVVNPILAQYLQATVTGTFADPVSDAQFLPATLPEQRLGGMREHAGVLSTQAWLSRFPTTPTNRNRHRVFVASKQFLATDVAALAVRPIDDGGNFKIAVMENPACAVCHNVIDPMAAGFQNWQENNRFRPVGTGATAHALPGNYRSGNYPRDASNVAYYRAGDNWFRDQKAPGYGDMAMPGGFTGSATALQWLGQQMASDARFAVGGVHFWYKLVVGRDPLKAPLDASTPENAARLAAFNAQNEEFQEISARFKTDRGNGTYNVKDLLTDLVMSKWNSAQAAANATAAGRTVELGELGGFNMLNPSALNRKLLALTGQTVAEFNNPYAGFGLNYGNFDGMARTKRPQEHTQMQSIAIDRAMATRSCSITQNDFTKTQATRLLFPMVNLDVTPATPTGQAAIQANIKHLHKWLWKDDVAVSDAEVQRTYELFTQVWADRANAPARTVTCAYNNTNDPNYTGRSWAAVMAYMLGDPKFLFE